MATHRVKIEHRSTNKTSTFFTCVEKSASSSFAAQNLHALNDTLSIKSALHRTTQLYTKYWLAQTDLLGCESITLVTAMSSSAGTDNLAKPFVTKPTVRSPALCPATSQDSATLQTRTRQKFPASRPAKEQPHIQPYNSYPRITRSQNPKLFIDSLLSFSTTATISL